MIPVYIAPTIMDQRPVLKSSASLPDQQPEQVVMREGPASAGPLDSCSRSSTFEILAVSMKREEDEIDDDEEEEEEE